MNLYIYFGVHNNNSFVKKKERIRDRRTISIQEYSFYVYRNL